MNLSQETAAALDDRIARGETAGDLVVDRDGRRLNIALTDAAPVGVAFDRLDFHVEGPDHAASTPDLRAWGDRLSGQITYLMEPLVVLEVDPIAGDVELRSEKPSARGDLRSYYEIRLTRPRSLTLQRVAFNAADRNRRPAPCQLSREALERLIADLDDSIDG